MCVDCISNLQNKLPPRKNCSSPAFAPRREDFGLRPFGLLEWPPVFNGDFDPHADPTSYTHAVIPPPFPCTAFIPPSVGRRRRSEASASRGAFGGQIGNISVVSYPAITEEYGGTSGQTAKLESISAMPASKYQRFESCVAIAGANYCVIAADYTRDHPKISQLTEKSLMASCGFQAADLKALQDALFLRNLIYEYRHEKPMSCLEINRLLPKELCKYSKGLPFTVLLGGIDSQGKGCIYTNCIGCYEGVGYNSQEEEEKLIMPPILNYKLPAKDVLTRLSETEAVVLAKTIFESTTHTGDKLEIVVLNASGLRHESMDLASPMDPMDISYDISYWRPVDIHRDLYSSELEDLVLYY